MTMTGSINACNVFDDLVPLYVDGVCSDDSRHLVEEHMNQCSSCKAKHDGMISELLLDQEAIEHNLKAHDALTRVQQRKMARDLFGQCVCGGVCAPLLGYAIGATDLGYWLIGGVVFNLATYGLAWLVSGLRTGAKRDGVRGRARLVGELAGLIGIVGGLVVILFGGAFASSRWKALIVFGVLVILFVMLHFAIGVWKRKQLNGSRDTRME